MGGPFPIRINRTPHERILGQVSGQVTHVGLTPVFDSGFYSATILAEKISPQLRAMVPQQVAEHR